MDTGHKKQRVRMSAKTRQKQVYRTLKHYAEPISAYRIARDIGVSPRHASRIAWQCVDMEIIEAVPYRSTGAAQNVSDITWKFARR